MRRVLAVCSLLLLSTLTSCVSTTPSPAVAPAETAHIRQLESSKWDPALSGNRDEFMALFADDFVSVEYGSDVHGGVHRRTRADVFSGPPLSPARFELSDWHFIQASGDVIVVSYRIKGLSFPWQAYATSVWALRDGKWQTVFYQASTAE